MFTRNLPAFAAHLDQPMCLLAIADAAGASRSRLVKLFRRDTGMAVGEFIRAARLHRACRRLRETNEPLKEVALACGFYDQSHMTRVFREELSLTPSHYRRSPSELSPPPFEDSSDARCP